MAGLALGHARPMTDPGIEYVVRAHRRRRADRGPVPAAARRPGRSSRPAMRSCPGRGSSTGSATPDLSRFAAGPWRRTPVPAIAGRNRRTRPGSRSGAARRSRSASSCSSSAGTGGWPPANTPSRSTRRSPASSTRSGPESGSASARKGRVIRGVEALGEPTRGRPRARRRNPARAQVRASCCGPEASTSASPATILVVGSRVDAEALTRARAMGLRGVIVGGLAGKERRDFLASEARQRASLHELPTFAVLVLDGAIRRRIAGPDRRRLRRAGRTRSRDRHGSARARLRRAGDRAAASAPATSSGSGRASGPAARAAGRAWPGCGASPTERSSRRAGWQFDGWPPVPVPLADLERFG